MIACADNQVPEGALAKMEDLPLAADSESREAPASRPRILLVEDDWTTHSALRKILTRLGWDVQSAMTVSGALSMLKLQPRAIILDMMLPDGDGLEVLRRVRAENHPARVAVTTGIEDRKRLEEIRKLAPDALLHKPVVFDELLRVLQDALAT